MNEKIEIKSFLRDKVDIVNMRKMRSGWSKLLNQQENVLVLTNRGRVVGFYIPYELAKTLPNEHKVLFLYLLNAYAKKAVPELGEITETEVKEESVNLGGS